MPIITQREVCACLRQLEIPNPEKLTHIDARLLKKTYLRLAQKYHPDIINANKEKIEKEKELQKIEQQKNKLEAQEQKNPKPEEVEKEEEQPELPKFKGFASKINLKKKKEEPKKEEKKQSRGAAIPLYMNGGNDEETE